MSYLFTSEAVTKGHPDKLCDQIADAILTECLNKDKESKVACEVCTTTGTVILMGEITTNSILNYKDIARDVIKSIGYTNADYGLDYESCSVVDLIDKQSSEICEAVNNSMEYRGPNTVDPYDIQGAGDQGIIFGYACNETKEFIPLSIHLAHKLARKLEDVRELNAISSGLRPDGKTQVTVKYSDEGVIDSIDTILISAQHNPDVNLDLLTEYLIDTVITPVIEEQGLKDYMKEDTKIIINPSGSFIVGGPQGDTGLTGRKLAVDTYGGHAKFGGGALCGKDPSKVDRSAAYMSRYIAKHLVASKICTSAEVQISYGIGMAHPISVNVKLTDCIVPDSTITKSVKYIFDMRPAAIINNLNLKEFNYRELSGSCQFGNDFAPWEILDPKKIEQLKDLKYDYMKSYLSDS